MELRHLRYFAAAAAEGSFHRAAARLNIAQPALSRQIRDLEQGLNLLLFVRSSHGAKLSPAGEVLLAEVGRLLPQIELLKSRTQRAAVGKFGLLRIGYTPLAAELRFTVAAFADARRLLPDVDIRFSMVSSDHQADALMSGEIDVGLLYRRPALPPRDLIHRDLRTDHYVLLVHSRHPLTKRTPLRLADLREESFAFPSPTLRPIVYREMMSACLKGGFTPRIILELDNNEAMFNIAAEGVAVGFTNSALRDRRPAKEVALLPIEDLDMPLHLAAMWRRDRETPAIACFIDLLHEHMNKGGEIHNNVKSLRVV